MVYKLDIHFEATNTIIQILFAIIYNSHILLAQILHTVDHSLAIFIYFYKLYYKNIDNK